MSQGFLRSIDNTSANISVISERDQDIMRTNITAISASQTTANLLEVAMRNSGQIKLASFEKWDIIVHSTDGSGTSYVTWLPYTGGVLGNNQWHVKGIYLDIDTSTGEAFEPDILNPEEEMIIECQLDPGVGAGTINLISITTPNGITVSKSFTGYQP